MIQILSDICDFADGRVAVADLDLDSYISTENMLPNIICSRTTISLIMRLPRQRERKCQEVTKVQ